MLTARLAFDAEQMATICGLVLEGPTPLPSRHVAVPASLDVVVARALCKLPEERFANLGELATALAPLGPPGSLAMAERCRRIVAGGARPSAVSGFFGDAATLVDPRPDPLRTPVIAEPQRHDTISTPTTKPILPRGRRAPVGLLVGGMVAAIAGALALALWPPTEVSVTPEPASAEPEPTPPSPSSAISSPPAASETAAPSRSAAPSASARQSAPRPAPVAAPRLPKPACDPFDPKCGR